MAGRGRQGPRWHPLYDARGGDAYFRIEQVASPAAACHSRHARHSTAGGAGAKGDTREVGNTTTGRARAADGGTAAGKGPGLLRRTPLGTARRPGVGRAGTAR